MGLTAALARWAARRPHVLLVPAPGATAVRLAGETVVRQAGGVLATSPADADVLLIAGAPGPELTGAVELVWAQLPGPRARAEAHEPEQVGGALLAALAELTDPAQVAWAADRHDEWGASEGDMPGGLAMADRGPDRDGLSLDVLSVPLGPVLPDWPAGVVVDTALQGDVIQRAEARPLDAPAAVGTVFWHGALARRAAAHLDSLGRLLAVAGWDDAAGRARALRDELLDETPAEQVRPAFAALRRRVDRSRALRWATDGLGALPAAAAARRGVGGPAARAGGDVTARWRQWLADTDALLSGRDPDPDSGPRGPADPASSRALLAVATELMCGLDLAAARLVLASFDPDPDELAASVGTSGVAG